MAIKVLEEPKPQTKKCFACGTLFEFEVTDIRCLSGHYPGVFCPRCKTRNPVESR